MLVGRRVSACKEIIRLEFGAPSGTALLLKYHYLCRKFTRNKFKTNIYG